MKQVQAPELITRDDAQTAGRARYYTGRPCKRGHMCERFVVNAGCVECVNRKRTPGLRAANVMVLEIPIYEAIPGEFLVELKGLIYGWIDHVMLERGYRKPIVVDWGQYKDPANPAA